METSIKIKEITFFSEEGKETFYHAFLRENDKVTSFSIMTDIKGK